MCGLRPCRLCAKSDLHQFRADALHLIPCARRMLCKWMDAPEAPDIKGFPSTFLSEGGGLELPDVKHDNKHHMP